MALASGVRGLNPAVKKAASDDTIARKTPHPRKPQARIVREAEPQKAAPFSRCAQLEFCGRRNRRSAKAVATINVFAELHDAV